MDQLLGKLPDSFVFFFLAQKIQSMFLHVFLAWGRQRNGFDSACNLTEVIFSCLKQIPQTGWNNLFISFIPADTGKATAKTNKATVRNGTCKWADPIYETARLLQDSKTKHFEEKLYKLVVAMVTILAPVILMHFSSTLSMDLFMDLSL